MEDPSHTVSSSDSNTAVFFLLCLCDCAWQLPKTKLDQNLQIPSEKQMCPNL